MWSFKVLGWCTKACDILCKLQLILKFLFSLWLLKVQQLTNSENQNKYPDLPQPRGRIILNLVKYEPQKESPHVVVIPVTPIPIKDAL